MKDPLDDALGLPPLQRAEPEIIVPDQSTGDEDYEHARRNLYRLMAKAEVHLDELGEVASISQHPRAYEVLANFYRTVVDVNKDLMGIKKVQKEVSDSPGGGTGPRTVNNNLIMTSEELLRMIKGQKE